MKKFSYKDLKSHYEKCFFIHGDTFKGVDWPNPEDANLRYKIMLDVQRNDLSGSILDIGCGLAHLYEYIQFHNLKNNYIGLDISDVFIKHCKNKFPDVKFICADLIKDPLLETFDYAILNGIFTEKLSASDAAMKSFFKKIIQTSFLCAKKGIAFNVMSTSVDWKRNDLFHVKKDWLSNWLSINLSRNFIFRCDYGLWEYTVYVYKDSYS